MKPERWKEIKQIYEAVLEQKAGGRAAFLAQACAGDEELRLEVESLLAYEEKAEDFIEVPALKIAAKVLAQDPAPPALCAGEELSQYRILKEVGAGGMGVVYKAVDIKLDRHVALKFLPQEFAEDRHSLERFQREARAVAALDHPNICTIHNIAEDRGRPFIVMQWLEGETLKQKIREKALQIEEILDLGIQIAGALDSVHAKGFIHRDIKPANIIISKEGQAKVLDFGLAKIKESRHAAVDGRDATDSGLTNSGMTLGTVGYMSPEQVLGEPLDSRTDLFSLGVVLYEMATGTSAFQGNTTGAILDQIVHKSPAPASVLNSTVSADLERIIEKALEKNPASRYQSAAELRSDLSAVRTRTGLERKRPGTPARLLASSGRKIGKRLLTIAVVLMAFAGLVLWATRTPAFSFDALDTIVLGDLQNSTGDSALDDTIDGALRIALEQSRYVDVLSTTRVRQALSRMQKTEEDAFPDDIAREVCRRERAQILITGTISRPGREYLLRLKLVDCSSGDLVRTFTERVGARDKVLPAVDGLAKEVRLALGESPRSVTESQRPLAEATTSSLDAFKLVTDGNRLSRKGRHDDALVLYHRAVELDPEFAMAYAILGSSYNSFDISKDHRKSEQYFQEALKRLDRVTERERLEILELYYSSRGPQQKALSYARLMVDAYPKTVGYRFNVARILQNLGQQADAIKEYQEVVRLDPNASNALVNIAVCYDSLKQYDQAASYYEKAFALWPEGQTDPIQNHQYGWVLINSGQEARARSVFEQMLAKSGTQKARGYRSFGILALYRGQFQEAGRQLEEASRLNEVIGGFNSAARDLLYLGEALVLVGQPQAGLHQLDRALAVEKGNLAAPQMLRLSAVYSRAQQPAQARKLLERGKAIARPDNAIEGAEILRAEAELALSGQASEEAVEKLRRARAFRAGNLIDLSLAASLVRTGHNEEAIEIYEGIVSSPPLPWEGQVEWVLAHQKLALLYETSGQTAKARTFYLKMLELWAGADPNIRPVEEVRQALRRMGS